MKIAMYYTRPFETGGVEKTMLERGRLLSEAGHEITYVINANDSPVDMLDEWAEDGDVVYYKYLNDSFDVCIYDAVYNLKKVNAKKYIQVINGCLIDSNERYEEIIPFDEYVAVSEEAGQQFEKLKHKKCRIIPNIIDSEKIKKLSKEKVDIEKKSHNFVVVSRIDKQKGFPRLERFLQECQKRYGDDYQVVSVGSCYLYPQYANQLKKNWTQYNIIWEGKQDNPYKYMKWADALIQLSDYESQCMVMYEALILGTPCICTNFDNAVKELKNGRGVLVDINNPEFDFEAIENLKKCFKYSYADCTAEWLDTIKIEPKKDVKFSVIIPNYNNEQWLEKCLNSVLNQTYKNYEIIFVDDMSTDNSVKIAKKLLKDHKVILNKSKRLNGGSRNVGIVEATGDYILCLDSDDWLKDENVFKKLNDLIYKQDVIFTGFDLYDGKDDGLYPFIPKYKNLYDAFINDVCAIWTKVVKREILQDTLFPEGTLAEDKVHHYRIIEKCNSFDCLQESTHVWNRANPTSTTTERTLEWDASCIKHGAEMYKFIKTTKNEDYRKFVTERYKRHLKDMEKQHFIQF